MSCPWKKLVLFVRIEIDDARDQSGVRIDQIGERYAFACRSQDGDWPILGERFDGSSPLLTEMLFGLLKLKSKREDGAGVGRERWGVACITDDCLNPKILSAEGALDMLHLEASEFKGEGECFGAKIGVKLSKRVTSLTRLQNRTCAFQRIRLLNNLAFVIGTVDMFCMSFIVAMAMQSKFIAQFLSSPLTLWRQVVDFDEIAI
jgi:hypothetical protein